MVGLPFPNSGASNREQSWDNGTPFSSSGDIPIDPALSETPVDPALLAEEGMSRRTEVRFLLIGTGAAREWQNASRRGVGEDILRVETVCSPSLQTPQPSPLFPSYQSSRVDSYPQGPQGDPFPQPPPVYLPVEEPVPLPAKPVKKRKRPVAREEECGFCSGNDLENKHGQPELMVSCVDCGRSGMFLPSSPYCRACAYCAFCMVRVVMDLRRSSFLYGSRQHGRRDAEL